MRGILESRLMKSYTVWVTLWESASSCTFQLVLNLHHFQLTPSNEVGVPDDRLIAVLQLR
jgi:hypothetical protein